MIPATSRRVPLNTAEQTNRWIRQEMRRRVAYYRQASREEIDQRLDELDHEWDTERTLETNASIIAFTGCVLSVTVDRRWILLPMTVTAFLFQHAIQGWCPPLPLIRGLGVRTMREIEEERMALIKIRDGARSERDAQPRPHGTR